MLRGARETEKLDDDDGLIVRKSERAYQWLRDEILSFRMQPGVFIDKVEICAKLDVSKQPVTAALSRLEQEGLVEIYPQRGSYVARLRLVAMSESLFIRGALEAAAVRRIAEDGNELLLRSLTRNLEAQDQAILADAPARFFSLDMEFHSAIARAVPYPHVAHQVDIGLATVKRCRELFRPDASSLRGAFSAHRRILDALLARQSEVAAREMLDHVADYAAMLRGLADARPELFVG
ncbi:GntR family transcriptional regulator [Siculibacillus lacustris]|nr:GntR family transcriptional regulator [Siculibacillus lacustris]